MSLWTANLSGTGTRTGQLLRNGNGADLFAAAGRKQIDLKRRAALLLE